jgi:hypothetical protein
MPPGALAGLADVRGKIGISGSTFRWCSHGIG